jgi:membrane-bound serine protease (ClpP class)
MWPTIAGLLALGALLILIEVFIPGMIVGICGGIAIIAAVVLAYAHEGLAAGNWLLAAVLVAGACGFAWWLRYVPRSWLARRWTLHATIEGKIDDAGGGKLAGAAGKAVTALRPAGTALIAGERVDVVAESDLIEAGESVRVVRVEGARVVVQRAE